MPNDEINFDHALTLRQHDTGLAVARLAPDAEVPGWANGPLTSITRTAEELSIVCAEKNVPGETTAERGWRALSVAGPLDFELTGVLASLTGPLAAAGIPVFGISTYDTDYLLVRATDLPAAVDVLLAAGHRMG